jgi:hypothetical protein
MRVPVVLFTLALLAGVPALPAAAADSATLSGRIVYVNCYLKYADTESEDYKSCSAEFTRRGQSLALVTADGMYIIKGDWTRSKNERLNEFIDRHVQVIGDVSAIADKKLIKIVDVRLPE